MPKVKNKEIKNLEDYQSGTSRTLVLVPSILSCFLYCLY